MAHGIVGQKYESLLNLIEPTKTLEEGTINSMTELLWYDASVAISSVSDVGGNASFNFTPGPTLTVGAEVRITGFVTETNYNGTWLVTATSAGDFEIGETYTGDDTGDFEVITDRVLKLAADDCYKSLYEDRVDFIEDEIAPLANSIVQTTDNTVTTILTILGASLSDGDYRLDASVHALDTGPTDLAEYIGLCYFTVTSSVASINASGQAVIIETAVAWTGVSFSIVSNDLIISVQGTGATTINWTAKCSIVAV